MKKNILTTLALGALLPVAAQAQTWSDTDADASWSNPNNWGGSVPSAAGSAVLIIANTSNTNFIALDTGSPSNAITSITFNSGIAPVEITPGGVETLSVSGAINNQSSIRPKFSTALTATGSGTWTGPLQFSNTVNVDANTITTAGNLLFDSGINLNLSITGLNTYGKFVGAGTETVSGVNIYITSSLASSTFVAGSTFDFTTGSFTGATLKTAELPALGNGLSWDTSQFASQGLLTVISNVPEPSTWAALAGSIVLGVAAYRRRKTA